jgi:elongator complex protein 3
MSGITPVTVLTKPFPCPGNCLYCPQEPGMPKSYLSNEPAAMRAKGYNFSPRKQVLGRIKALEKNAHTVDKLEILVLGGSWSAYPKKYQEWFIKECFDSANGVRSKTLTLAQKKNETAKYRIIGLTLETRPNLITLEEISFLRKLGCTRIQLGIQHLDDKILKLNNRHSTAKEAEIATALLKSAGFKVDWHLMPDLPGTTPAKDLWLFKETFKNPAYKPDQIKIYPTVVNEYAPLHQWFIDGRYQPYGEKKLFQILLQAKLEVPYYVRINRLVRDIPKESIEAGNNITNLRQALQVELKKQGLRCKCLRCREARENLTSFAKAKFFKIKYSANGGTEYFLSYESKNREQLYSFCRLRFNGKTNIWPKDLNQALDGACLIRELHTYGRLLAVDQIKSPKGAQHRGLGKRLMAEAEKIAKSVGCKKIAVISGIGVRGYYRKLGYRLVKTYMVKDL